MMKPRIPSLQPLPGTSRDPRERRAARRVAERILESGRDFYYYEQDAGEVQVPNAVVAAWVLRYIGGYSITEADMLDHVAAE